MAGDAVTASVEAPAKLTFGLRITGVRGDGYHLLDTEMATLDLADVLTITPGASGIAVDGPYADGVPVDGRNLVAGALRLAGVEAHVHVDKRIPHGGGLGGGSADAAAVLRWAGFTNLPAAATIGADVPFCVVGGRARVRGIGELIEPLELLARDVTLVIPPLRVNTAAAYRAWDALGGPTSDFDNDLEPAAIAVEPELATWRDRITEAAGTRPTLAGSGATWYLLGHHDLADALPDACVVLTKTRSGD